MYKYFGYGNILIGENEVHEGFSKNIKYCLNTQDNSQIFNTDFDENFSKKCYFDNKIRPSRNELLKSTDFLMLTDSPLSTEENSQLVIYRQSLRDLPGKILNNDFTDTSFPTKPVFI